MPVYIPDEKGELTALDSASVSDTLSQMPPGDLGASALKMLFSFLALIGLLLASYWLLKRLIRQRGHSRGSEAAIQILEKRILSPKTMLYLVEVDGKKILLAESQLEVRRLENFKDSAETPELHRE